MKPFCYFFFYYKEIVVLRKERGGWNRRTMYVFFFFSQAACTGWINVMLSPLRRILPEYIGLATHTHTHDGTMLPRGFFAFFLSWTSWASSMTRFMYSSKPCAKAAR